MSKNDEWKGENLIRTRLTAPPEPNPIRTGSGIHRPTCDCPRCQSSRMPKRDRKA